MADSVHEEKEDSGCCSVCCPLSDINTNTRDTEMATVVETSPLLQPQGKCINCLL